MFKVESRAGGSNLYVWTDPVIGGAEPSLASADWSYVASTTPGGGGFATTSNFTEWSFDSSNQAVVQFDALRFGDTFAEVTPVPEPGALALASLGIVALLCRRR